MIICRLLIVMTYSINHVPTFTNMLCIKGTLIDGMSDASLKKVISESDASKLSTIFGENWESVLLNLGLRKAEIDQVLESNGHKVQKTITACLIRWKKRKGNEATLSNFIQVLKNSEKESHAHIDWDRLKEVV